MPGKIKYLANKLPVLLTLVIYNLTFSSTVSAKEEFNSDYCCQLKRSEPKTIFEKRNEYLYFCRWLKQYIAPTICPIYLCNGRCAMGANPCPSFSSRIKFYATKNHNVIIGSACCKMLVDENDTIDLTLPAP